MAAVDEGRKGETRTGRRGLPNISVLPGGWIPLIKPHNRLLTHLYIGSFIQQLTTGTLFVPGAVVTARYAVVSQTGMVPAFLQLTVQNYAT